MALEVEDGTGKANANAYISLTDADAYFAARKVDTWKAKTSAEREAAIVRATFSLDSWLRGRWNGVKKTSTQSLAWPRISALGATTGITDEDGYELATDAVPQVVAWATAEVALIELSGRFLQESVGSSNAIASESVGPISVSYRGDAPSITYYPHVEAMLRGVAAVGGVQLNMSISLTAEEIEALNGSSSDPFDYAEYFNIIKWP